MEVMTDKCIKVSRQINVYKVLSRQINVQEVEVTDKCIKVSRQIWR